ncbi:MAG TPA: prepilin-type N-terminal cleavage/methylation domain-containing protein [Pyrinomonadaceae bacterium]|nr:prepilin-type N-terminal cleavage/methylation domain-containing protein [Pyrinomonadaceae bacterium]
MRERDKSRDNAAGFSLIELLIAMVITLTVMTVATTMIARSLRVRARENKRSDALADAQRALNLMSREISNAGFRMKTNGIVWQDSNDDNSIRVLANLNKYTGETDNGVTEPGEDVKFFISDNTQYLVRYDKNRPDTDPLQKTVLANRVYSLYVFYYPQTVNYTTGDCDNPVTVTTPGVTKLSGSNIANATYVVLSLCVDLPAEGTPGSPGYQPASQTLLVSDVALRNVNSLYY